MPNLYKVCLLQWQTAQREAEVAAEAWRQGVGHLGRDETELAALAQEMKRKQAEADSLYRELEECVRAGNGRWL